MSAALLKTHVIARRPQRADVAISIQILEIGKDFVEIPTVASLPRNDMDLWYCVARLPDKL